MLCAPYGVHCVTRVPALIFICLFNAHQASCSIKPCPYACGLRGTWSLTARAGIMPMAAASRPRALLLNAAGAPDAFHQTIRDVRLQRRQHPAHAPYCPCDCDCVCACVCVRARVCECTWCGIAHPCPPCTHRPINPIHAGASASPTCACVCPCVHCTNMRVCYVSGARVSSGSNIGSGRTCALHPLQNLPQSCACPSRPLSVAAASPCPAAAPPGVCTCACACACTRISIRAHLRVCTCERMCVCVCVCGCAWLQSTFLNQNKQLTSFFPS